MDEDKAKALALTLSFQMIWQASQRYTPNAPGNRVYTSQNAIDLGRRFGTKFIKDAGPAPEQSSSTQMHYLLNTIGSVFQEIDRYENAHLQELALALVPFDELTEKATHIEKESGLGLTRAFRDLNEPPLVHGGYQLESGPRLRCFPAYQDAFAQALVRWAKDDFLKWADPIKCSECGGATVGVSGGLPSPQEVHDGAGRVELYRCINTSSPCHGKITRFPRYTNLEKLLQTRTGRCGEFAAVFMLLSRALDMRARYIWNSEDHVWNEYFSEDLKRWVHIDSCEGARDKNLLYDRGWGKKMKYCIAFGADGLKDVTRSYVSDWPTTLARRDASLESALASQLSNLTRQRRLHLTPAERSRLDEEDTREKAWLGDIKKREEELEKEELVGRTSGTKEWRAQRSETGSKKGAVPSMKAGKRIEGISIDSVSLNGTAKIDKSRKCIVLTEDKPGQIGSAFLAFPSTLQEYIITFNFKVCRQGSEGADGLAFVLHSDPRGLSALGESGSGLGYAGLKNSCAVEIDTYRSRDTCDDPPTPHISVQTKGSEANSAHHNHSIFCTEPGSLPDVTDGREYSVRLEISQSQRQMRIFFTETEMQEFIELTEVPVDIPVFPGEPFRYMGWTAATGGLHQEHVITDFEIWEANPPDEGSPSVAVAKDVI